MTPSNYLDTEDLKQIMVHFAAAISAETENANQYEQIRFEINGRSAELEMSTGTITYKQEMFVNRLFDKMDERADNNQQKVEEELAPLNHVDTSSAESKDVETGKSDGQGQGLDDVDKSLLQR